MKTYYLAEELFDKIMFKIETETGSTYIPDNIKLGALLEELEKDTEILCDTLKQIKYTYETAFINYNERKYIVVEAVCLFYEGISLNFEKHGKTHEILNRISNDPDPILDYMNDQKITFDDLDYLSKMILRMAGRK